MISRRLSQNNDEMMGQQLTITKKGCRENFAQPFSIIDSYRLN